jgi:hypothetical protein
MNKFGIIEARDSCYGCAAALSYWVFRCRDKNKSPAMGTATWTYLESSIQNSAEISTNIEDYLQYLTDKLISHLRPKELIWVVQPSEKIVRINEVGELLELNQDQDLALYSWQEMVNLLAIDGYSEWDVLELCRTKSSIIQVLCRLRFEQDRALGKEVVEDFIEVVVNV